MDNLLSSDFKEFKFKIRCTKVHTPYLEYCCFLDTPFKVKIQQNVIIFLSEVTFLPLKFLHVINL